MAIYDEDDGTIVAAPALHGAPVVVQDDDRRRPWLWVALPVVLVLCAISGWPALALLIAPALVFLLGAVGA